MTSILKNKEVFFRLKTQELGLRLNQAQSVILNHNPSIGLLFEEILRSFLSNILPGKYKVTQGFVQNAAEQSHQCDIIVYDYINYAPSYKLGSIDIIPAKAVKAVIEVKSSINRSRFQDTLKPFKKLGEIGVDNKYLICYNSAKLTTVEGYFSQSNKGSNQSDFFIGGASDILYDVDNVNYLPTGIVSLNQNFYLSLGHVQTADNDYIGYNCYSISDRNGDELASLQYFLFTLFNKIECNSESIMPDQCFSDLILKDAICLCQL